MNKIKLLFILIFLAFVAIANGQKVKPEFRKFIMVAYRPSGNGNKKFIRIEDYLEISNDGVFHCSTNHFEDYYGYLSFKGAMSDTTYRMPDSLILMINKV